MPIFNLGVIMTEKQQKEDKKAKCFCGEVVKYDPSIGAFFCNKCSCSMVVGSDFDIVPLSQMDNQG